MSLYLHILLQINLSVCTPGWAQTEVRNVQTCTARNLDFFQITSCFVDFWFIVDWHLDTVWSIEN